MSEILDSNRTVLVICGFAPNENAMSSGQKLAFAKTLELAAQFGAVKLIYFVNDIDALDEAQRSWPINVTVLKTIRLNKRMRILGALRYPFEPVFVSSRRYALRGVIERQVADHALTDFYADFAQGIAAVPPRFHSLFTLRQHDIVSRLYERLGAQAVGLRHWAYRLEAWRARRWEARTWSHLAAIVTLSRADAATIRTVSPTSLARAEPIRGTIDTDPARRTADTIVPGRIGFWGNMARQENVDAVQHMVRALLPEIRKREPRAHFWIMGAHPTDAVRNLEADDVHVTGFVEDPTELFASLAVAVAPLRLGSGVKIKVFETIDAGVPTVVSPVGGEGIEDQALLRRAETDVEFVEMVTTLLNAAPN